MNIEVDYYRSEPWRKIALCERRVEGHQQTMKDPQ